MTSNPTSKIRTITIPDWPEDERGYRLSADRIAELIAEYVRYRQERQIPQPYLDIVSALSELAAYRRHVQGFTPETKAPALHVTLDGAWKEFLQNTASDRTTWEAFQYAWIARGELDPTWAQLEAQCQAIWRTNVTLVCQLGKGHTGAHSSGRHTWNGEVDARPSAVETSGYPSDELSPTSGPDPSEKASACECPEVCTVCGGRAKACALLGHRPEGERYVKWHKCAPKAEVEEPPELL